MHLCSLISFLKIIYLPFTSFDVQKIYVLTKECVNASGVHIRISRDYFAKQTDGWGFLTQPRLRDFRLPPQSR